MITVIPIIDSDNVLTHLKVTSDLFTVPNITSPLTTTVNVRRNCCGDYSLEIDDEALFTVDIQSGLRFIQLNAEFFSSADDNVPDGVYYIEIVVKNTNTGSTTKQRICFFNGHLLKCALINYIADNPNSDIFKFYLALTFVNNCSDCNCENACVIYNELLKKLKNSNNHDCGC